MTKETKCIMGISLILIAGWSRNLPIAFICAGIGTFLIAELLD